MFARVAKEEMALLLPNSLTNYANAVPASTTRPAHGLTQKLANGLRWLVEMPRRRAVLDELAMLSDHELADIGLNRNELPRVFDPSFAARRFAA